MFIYYSVPSEHMKWQVAGGVGMPLAATVFCMLPLFTSSTGDIHSLEEKPAIDCRCNLMMFILS
ncbi:unnamed protein product [Diatraea saccharalis]|uniref:Uncharacterized protein n=1 Tax=Diatraea saccharalis TaxID=40085 RepID=A0A9N9RF31_9NEOP|nr:unnamed protein product [Diatraea saccharalis]